MAQVPRAVIIPFGVPPEGRGLGLGLAALVHGAAQIEGGSIGLAQLMAKKNELAKEDQKASPVETFLPPPAWKDLVARGDSPPDVSVVITGAFEPPSAGPGLLQLLAFDARDGHTRARVDAHLDEADAGSSLVQAFDELLKGIGCEPSLPRGLADLEWDALESVLRAERCVLHDAAKGGPHDRLAAMMHLGRAVEDAPDSGFAAGRLAAVAIEAAGSSKSDSAMASAALRTLTRAMQDAPSQVDLLEACAALQARLGLAAEAEASANAALAIDPTRSRLYALLSEACRARGDHAGAIAALGRGTEVAPDDLVLLTEKGILFAAVGEEGKAREVWRRVVAKEPIYPPAFANLAALAMRDTNETEAQLLVDRVLAAHAAQGDVIRQAIALALAKEPVGLPRAARLARLSRSIVERLPNDAWALLVLAQALAQAGEHTEALARYRQVEDLAAGSALAAQATRGRLALEEPRATLEIDACLRAATATSGGDLERVVARAKRLGIEHGIWSAWLAAGIGERRRGELAGARSCIERALDGSPGCTLAHVELVAIAVAEKDHAKALHHAERVRELEGETARSLGALATAYLAADRLVEARITAERAVALAPHDPAAVVLVAKVRARMEKAPSLLDRIKGFFSGK